MWNSPFKDITATALAGKWQRGNGYLSFVTDDRNTDYGRPYLGHLGNPKNRVMQHLVAIIKCEDSTLHYYIVAKGDGHCAINIIELWTLCWPDHISCHISMNACERRMAGAYAKGYSRLKRSKCYRWTGKGCGSSSKNCSRGAMSGS
ncbi:hypothetical protein BO86DRAFT_167200 [Aspergillus japonicus CBS 114.51]|uniref:Uncharacterized protein n=2 Tax=Aspergillus TaxID=5052 RepID=A0A2V5HDJ1_ASPV1|nr:hypothetical protein BO86DRAFT_167200 [Aspergillus japonicus CBS 114.51]PYI22408.1 hypothetical protein BO99DRAFT_5525 [Aspergillus violaceofuscus CBS 115571]RAH85808.1 hypothetical protein BO86DRAFT_167200 [Aspergillus japonicus CBS 114.51]